MFMVLDVSGCPKFKSLAASHSDLRTTSNNHVCDIILTRRSCPSGDLAVSSRKLGTCSAGKNFEDVVAKAWVNPGGPS